jgi:4-hydroxy-L-threonine phosphate dehydrogenase PdxA
MSDASLSGNAVGQSTSHPVIALTMGDAAGIGPELLIRSALDDLLPDSCRLVAVGHPELLRRAARLLNAPVEIEVAADFATAAERSRESGSRSANGSGQRVL